MSTEEKAVEPASYPTLTADEKKKNWVKAGSLGVAIAAIGCFFAIMFLWPMTTTDPKGINLGVVAPEKTQAQVVKQLESQDKDLFDITTYSDEAAAKKAVEEREITGAFVVGSDGSKQMLTASAGNAQVTQMLTQMANGMSTQGEAQAADAAQKVKEAQEKLAAAQQAGQDVPADQQAQVEAQAKQVEALQANAKVEVTDVVANANAQLGMLTVLPVLIGGVAGSMIATLAVKKRYMRFATLGIGALAMGLLGSLIMGTWFGLLEGNYWVDAAAIALGMLSIAACITGLASVLGMAGVGLGVVVFMLFANPWGGSMMPTEFLATPWGTIGAHMPNGTVMNLLKNLSFFPDASTGGQWLTLAIWAVAGLLLLWLGSVLNHGKIGRKKAAASATEASKKEGAHVAEGNASD
ncbi:ABC transporter permease [Galactobacter sp.]|uniref:ABC transporter permease n=1 Tax=Galactobacter sp. TaxID=2676125 RepID=UPI0025BE61CA|nr:ABC transporter permease [Galactobacter sp.]